jgi:hypothetical protein
MSAQAGGASRHAASSQDAEPAQGGSADGSSHGTGAAGSAKGAASESSGAPGSAGFSSAWTPRSVSETWPLPVAALSEEDEGAGVSDPRIGN